jgi:uncharacterized protein YjbJ (UPF0337 family)
MINLQDQVKTNIKNTIGKVQLSVRSFFVSMSLAVLLAIVIVFGFSSGDSWAITSTQLVTQPQIQIATVYQNEPLINRAQAAQKDVEGQVQEAIGKVTGNRKDQVMGRAKQVESRVMNAIEDVKDQFRDILH